VLQVANPARIVNKEVVEMREQVLRCGDGTDLSESKRDGPASQCTCAVHPRRGVVARCRMQTKGRGALTGCW
jgi:hypothetical protein